MTITLIHLSDIHFQVGRNVILNRIDKLFNSLKNEILGSQAVIIITSGDIAFSGQIEEYKIAAGFYKQLFNSIKTYSGIQSSLVFVPGNHDLLIEQNNEKLRKLILKDFASNGFNDLSEELIDICCEPQANYFKFVKGIKIKNPGDILFEHKLLKVNTYKFGDKIVKFNCYNSAWHSSLKEQIGSMGYPVTYLENQVPVSHSDISISIIHHPFNWQSQESSKALREYLAKSSEIIISGHEHQSDEAFFSDFNRSYTTLHISSPALQDSDSDLNSGFNLLKLDLKENLIQKQNFEYDKNLTDYKKSFESEWLPIEKFNKVKDRAFQLKDTFITDLENPGASFTHSTADEIKLRDIYIPCTLNNITITKIKKPKFINFTDSSSALELGDKMAFSKVIFGNESSGKTALLKYTYLDYYKAGFYPVFLNADILNEINIDKIRALVGREFKKQYDEIEGTYETIDFDSIIILIDDFHRFKHKPSKPAFMNNILKLFNKVIITGSELMQFESYSASEEDKNIDIYSTFERYIIQEFGPTQRYNLINKWYRLGKDYLDNGERNEYYRLVDSAQDNISSIIGKNLIPAYPIYMLTILQALESEQADNNNNNSLHGYYYEMMITKSLKHVLKDKEEIGFYFTVAKEYFFLLFDSKIRFSPLDKADFLKFLDKHAIKYNLGTINPAEILQMLINGKILKEIDKEYVGPCYKYIYYFFVAKYLSDNIDSEVNKEIIDLMCDRVYREEYSNIMLFLSHLTKNKFIIEKLVEKSKKIFEEVSPIKLESDVDFINQLQTILPEQVLQDLDVEEARMEDLKEKEQYELMERNFEENKNDFEEYDLNEDFSTIDIIAKLTKALRTINILGNITRKSWGELVGTDKMDLAEETFMLGLRTLQSNFSLIADNQAAMVDHVKNIINKKFIRQQLTKAEIENISANFVFTLCSAFSFGIIKRIVNAIGSQKLSKTFEDIQSKHQFNSIKLINTGIKLDHYSGFPMTDLEKLKKSNEKNVLGLSILRNLVTDYLYMYNISFEKKQKVCQLLNIKISDQRYINNTSPIKKK